MSLTKTYRFYIQTTYLGAGRVEVFPLMESVSFEGVKDDLFEGVQKALSGDIKLRGNDFAIIEELRENADCDAIVFTVDIWVGTSYIPCFEGNVILRGCKFSTNRCEVLLQIERKSEYDCFNEFSREKVNLLEIVNRHTVKTNLGELEIFDSGTTFVSSQNPISGQQNNNAGINQLENWVVLENYNSGSYSTATQIYRVTVKTVWVRQRLTSVTPPLGIGWLNIGGNVWVKKPSTVVKSTTTPDSFGFYDIIYQTVGWNEVLLSPISIDNALELSGCLTKLINHTGPGINCNYQIVSNFLGINPDGLNVPSNTYYTKSIDYKKISVWQKTDVKRPNVSQNATKATTTAEEFLESLKATFNLGYKIEGGIFRIEHKSYFTSSNGHDATLLPSNLIQANDYSYYSNSVKVPRREEFIWMDRTDGDGGTFDGYDIIYPINCSDAKTTDKIDAAVVTTNMEAVLSGVGEGNISEQGFVFAATYTDNGTRVVLSKDKMNDYMGWESLIKAFHFYYRPLISGTYNRATNVIFARPSRQEEVKIIKFGHIENLNLDTTKRVKTNMGWGVIVDYAYDSLTCTLDLTLLQE